MARNPSGLSRRCAGLFFGVVGLLLALGAPEVGAQSPPATDSFVGRLDAIEARITGANQQIAHLSEAAEAASSALNRDAAPFDTAQRARQKVRAEVMAQLVAWDRAHRAGARAERYLPPGQAEDTQILLAAAHAQALSTRVGEIDVLQIIEVDVRRTRQSVAHRAGLGVQLARHHARAKSATETRKKLIAQANTSANQAQVAREVRASDADLENSLGMLLKNATERDFHRLKGTLRPPVSAELTAGYGPQKQANSMSYVRHSGLTWALNEGSPVQAVAAGLVVFSGRMEGFGQLLILDHGQQYHSIYAHLKQLDAKVGDTVERGAVIAKSGETGSFDGPKLYFELRKNGHPIDPTPWFIQP